MSLATSAGIDVDAPVARSSTWTASSGHWAMFPPSSLVTGLREGS